MFEIFAPDGWRMLCFIGGDEHDAGGSGGGGGGNDAAQPPLWGGCGAEAPRTGIADGGSPNAAKAGADGARAGGGAIARRPMDEIACAASGRATPRAMGCGVKAAPFILGAAPFIIGAEPFIIGAAPFDAGAAWPFEWPFAAGVGFRTPLSPKGSKEASAAYGALLAASGPAQPRTHGFLQGGYMRRLTLKMLTDKCSIEDTLSL